MDDGDEALLIISEELPALKAALLQSRRSD
jgi:hypothetical protein